ncbi:hypothetical protein D3C81_1291600 [compost metagenome]
MPVDDEVLVRRQLVFAGRTLLQAASRPREVSLEHTAQIILILRMGAERSQCLSRCPRKTSVVAANLQAGSTDARKSVVSAFRRPQRKPRKPSRVKTRSGGFEPSDPLAYSANGEVDEWSQRAEPRSGSKQNGPRVELVVRRIYRNAAFSAVHFHLSNDGVRQQLRALPQSQLAVRLDASLAVQIPGVRFVHRLKRIRNRQLRPARADFRRVQPFSADAQRLRLRDSRLEGIQPAIRKI